MEEEAVEDVRNVEGGTPWDRESRGKVDSVG
jgi:hypothetical protein